MSLFKRSSRPAAGSTYEGPVTYTTDPQIGGQPGYYALAEPQTFDHEDGTTTNLHPILEPPLRLTWIDDAPHDEEDGSGHFVVAADDEPYYSHMPSHIAMQRNLVQLEATVRGTSGVSAGE
jgi:hypothetical protein